MCGPAHICVVQRGFNNHNAVLTWRLFKDFRNVLYLYPTSYPQMKVSIVINIKNIRMNFEFSLLNLFTYATKLFKCKYLCCPMMM